MTLGQLIEKLENIYFDDTDLLAADVEFDFEGHLANISDIDLIDDDDEDGPHIQIHLTDALRRAIRGMKDFLENNDPESGE